MNQEATSQYNNAVKLGQKYYKSMTARGASPYPQVLDDLVGRDDIAGQKEIGLVNVPTSLIIGTKSEGRVSALAGNFMPLLDESTEFATKWIHLCEAHLSSEGIRDPIKCFEYLGQFYVEEGNKRASVLMSYGAPSIPANVIRVLPVNRNTPEIQAYYEFLEFYNHCKLYDIRFTRPGCYAKLLASLGITKDHEWSDAEKKHLRAVWAKFGDAFFRLPDISAKLTQAEAFLTWSEIYPIRQINECTVAEIAKKLQAIQGDLKAEVSGDAIAVSTTPVNTDKTLINKLFGSGKASVRIAFIYAYPVSTSAWTRAHEHGRRYLEEALPSKVSTTVMEAYDHAYYDVMKNAAESGYDAIIATTPNMIGASRRIAAEYKNIKVLNCALSVPYPGVRMFYSRIHECKFITGAIAGAMADHNTIGYIASYPIYGAIAGINAFAAGVKLTNPRATISLHWSCSEPDPLKSLLAEDVDVISNREATNAFNPHWALEWGTYMIEKNGCMTPLAVPCWNWGPYYEKISHMLLNGTWENGSDGKAINYWWGLDSGVIDIQFNEDLPSGVLALAQILKKGLVEKTIDPFKTKLIDNTGIIRNEGSEGLTASQLMNMDWLCDNVKGRIPRYGELLPASKGLVRLLGIYRDEIPPEIQEEKSL